MTSISSGLEYRLRAGSPMPTSSPGVFVLHSFMATLSSVYIDDCASSLPSSSQFQGQSSGGYLSASYSRLPLSEERFKGKINEGPAYVSESAGGYN